MHEIAIYFKKQNLELKLDLIPFLSTLETTYTENKAGGSPKDIGLNSSSLQDIIFNSFHLIFELWGLLPTNRVSISYVIVVQKKFQWDRKFTFYGWGYYFPRTLSANLHFRKGQKRDCFLLGNNGVTLDSCWWVTVSTIPK